MNFDKADGITSDLFSLLQGQADDPLWMVIGIGTALVGIILLLIKLNFASMRRTDERKLAEFYRQNKQD